MTSATISAEHELRTVLDRWATAQEAVNSRPQHAEGVVLMDGPGLGKP